MKTQFNTSKALLALADGNVWYGYGVGAEVSSVGEVVFNTAMTGYQEILTDPSYSRQIVTLTYPHIGNYGCNPQDEESRALWCAGLIIKDVPLRRSNFRATSSLQDYLKDRHIAALAGIDTRRLTRHLRNVGAQAGCLMSLPAGQAITPEHTAEAIARAKQFPGLHGMDLAKQVSTDKVYSWSQGTWQLGADFTQQNAPVFHVVAYDFGIKRNILRMLAQRGCKVTVVPAQTTVAQVRALNPDGVFLSNGPGDPEPCDYAIAATRELLASDTPIFGICLGHQILSLAVGAKTYKMKFGHHGANHPVRDLETGRVSITSQNHGFAVDAASLPADLLTTHESLFDGTLQGVRHRSKPAFSFQGHPEASPGPQDIGYLFDRFVTLMADARKA